MDNFYDPNKNRNDAGGAARVLRVQLPICDRVVSTEVAEDVSLPDYQPEIKRLLRVSATVQPPSHYVGGGAMEFSGAVDYCIYYTGNDGQMYCFPTSTDYVFRVPLEAGADFDLNDALICYAQSEPETIISRVSGPRRMSVKCRLRSHVKAFGSCVMEEKRRGEMIPNDQEEERLLCEAETTVSGYGVSAPLTVSDEVLLEQDEGENVEYRMISGDAQLLVQEAVCGNGRIGCRGEVVLKLLMQKEQEGELPMTVLRKIPFDGEVVMDGATVNSDAVVTGSCTELNLSMEDGRVLCEAEVVLEARTQRKETLSYTCDWYATNAESECVSQSYQLPQALRMWNGNFTQSESRSLEDVGLTPGAHIVDVAGTAVIDNVEVDKGRYVVNGKCRYALVMANDGEMSAKEVELPFRYTLDGSAVSDVPMIYEGQAQILTARARTDAERLAVDAELGIWLCILTEKEVQMVGSVSVGEDIRRPAGEILLCYPAKGDTLWSVGKRYHTSLDRLVQNNRLNNERRADDEVSLSDVRVLVI